MRDRLVSFMPSWPIFLKSKPRKDFFIRCRRACDTPNKLMKAVRQHLVPVWSGRVAGNENHRYVFTSVGFVWGRIDLEPHVADPRKQPNSSIYGDRLVPKFDGKLPHLRLGPIPLEETTTVRLASTLAPTCNETLVHFGSKIGE